MSDQEESELSEESETNSVSSNPEEGLVTTWTKEFDKGLKFPFKYTAEELRQMRKEYCDNKVAELRRKK